MYVISNKEYTGNNTLEIDIQDYKDDTIVIEGCYFHDLDKDCDGLRINNDVPNQHRQLPPRSYPSTKVKVRNCLFTNAGHPGDQADELASVVRGATAVFERCCFENNGKAVLLSTGDAVDIEGDMQHLSAFFQNCIFWRCSRRNILAQCNFYAEMLNCLVESWGWNFHEKSYGARSSDHGKLCVRNSLFYQEDFLSCIFRDVLKGSLLMDMFRNSFPWHPGFMRAGTTDNGGTMLWDHNYCNRWWLTHPKHVDKPMNKDVAEDLYEHLLQTVLIAVHENMTMRFGAPSIEKIFDL